MQTSIKSAMVVAALAAATLGPSPSFPDTTRNASGRRHVVEIHKFWFVPAEIEVSPGDTITWINRDIVPHTATAADESWDSGAIEKTKQWQIVAGTDTAGIYYCQFHPTMKARIQIVQ